jgi:tetratricopeptide (TPR) repeat protein
MEQKPAVATEELPDWLKDEEPAELPSEELPDWLKGETAEQPPAAPVVQADWQPEQPPVEVFPIFAAIDSTPTVEEAVPVPAKTAPALKAATPQVAPVKPVKAPSASAEKDHALYENSQLELQRGNLNEATQGYSKLIKKGKMLDEIIFDLREALYRHPVDVVIWQTLGDAYMRAQRLQDALDAYTKAEELLR